MNISIDGLGTVGGFGQGAAALLDALGQAEVEPSTVDVRVPSGGVRIPVYLADTTALEDYIPKRALRRVDHFSRLALLGACLALEDAGRLEGEMGRLGVIMTSGYGPARTTFAFLNSVIQDGDSLASPTHFSSSVHNAAAAYLSILLKATGPSLSVSQFEMSLVSGLLTARQWLAEGRAEAVLLGAVDEYCPVLGYCWQRFFGNNPDGGIDPLDFSAQTATPGEGAAFFFLTTAEESRSPTRYAQVAEASMGRFANAGFDLPADVPLILGADGHRQCGKRYDSLLSSQHTAAAYAPLYGSLPAGQGFDMAVAALSLKTGTLYRQPGREARPGTFQTITHQTPCVSDAVRCLKLGANREYGMIVLQREVLGGSCSVKQ